MFLPYFNGERAPLWREDLGGVLHGLRRGHAADDMLWAVLEGAALYFTIVVVIAFVLVDLARAWLNPKLRSH